MACGDKYKHLIVTVDGYTVDRPYGAFPVAGDYSGWLALATKLRGLANDAFLRLGEVEGAKLGSYPKYNALVPLQNNMIAHFDELEYDWHQISLTTGLIEEIGKAVQVSTEAVCLLESANDAIVAYGAKPDVVPDITRAPDEGVPWWVWALVGAGGTIVVGSLAYGAMNRARGRRREPPTASGGGAQGQVTARRPAGAAA